MLCRGLPLATARPGKKQEPPGHGWMIPGDAHTRRPVYPVGVTALVIKECHCTDVTFFTYPRRHPG